MHKACAYILPVPNAIGVGLLPVGGLGVGRRGWGVGKSVKQNGGSEV